MDVVAAAQRPPSFWCTLVLGGTRSDEATFLRKGSKEQSKRGVPITFPLGLCSDGQPPIQMTQAPHS